MYKWTLFIQSILTNPVSFLIWDTDEQIWWRGQTRGVSHPLAHTGSRWSTCSGSVGGSRTMRHFLWSPTVTTRGGRGKTTALDRRRLPCVTTQGSASGFGYLTFYIFSLSLLTAQKTARCFPVVCSAVRRRVPRCLWTALKTPETCQWRLADQNGWAQWNVKYSC